MAPRAIRLCCAAFRWTPVVFISAIVVWSYYAYVVQMCILTVESVPEKVIYLLLYHPLIVMFVWSYGKTIFTPVGTVPKKFYLMREDADKLMRETNEEAQKNILIDFARNSNLPVQNRTHSGAPRYCEKCRCIKPDRCHHCSVCGTCVLKMDHHCPWVNNCVGFTTYKFFVMFLGYALVYCIYVALTSLKYFISFWSGGVGHNMGKFHILFLFFVAVMFAISLISLFGYHCYLTVKNRSTLGLNHNMGRFHVLFLFFVAVMFGISLISLFGYHIYLTFKNRSTLESFRSPIFQSGPDKNGFSLGRYNNFIEIFGENRKLWFIPVFTSEGDGVTFQTQTTSSSSSYQTMGTTSPSTIPSSGDGVTYPTRTVDLDCDGLLADRQRWMEEGDLDSNMTNGYGSYNRDSGVRLGY